MQELTLSPWEPEEEAAGGRPQIEQWTLERSLAVAGGAPAWHAWRVC